MISGLDNIENSNVDLKSMIATLANHLKINLGKQDIRKVRIVKTPSNTSVVQVTFYSSAHCLRLLDNKKAHGSITNSDVFKYSMSANLIYINELLPQDTHKLLTAARNLKRSFGLFRVWHNKGQIFLQLNPHDRAILIHCHKDLEELSKSLSSDSAQQQQQIQNSQQLNYLQQPQEYYSLPVQFQQQVQLQVQQPQYQQQHTYSAQPQNKASTQQFNSQASPPFNTRQPQARFPGTQSNQRKQPTPRPLLQSQPSSSTQSNHQFNSNFTNRSKYTQNFQSLNRLSKNKNNHVNPPNNNYTPISNTQPSHLNYRPPFPTVPQSFSNPPTSLPSYILRQPVLQHNTPSNPLSVAASLTSPSPLPTHIENQNLSQNLSQNFSQHLQN